jgi:hypothetical protein
MCKSISNIFDSVNNLFQPIDQYGVSTVDAEEDQDVEVEPVDHGVEK